MQIGLGHVMRCATLAQALVDCGAEVHFLCRELSGSYCDWLSDRGLAVHRLPPPPDPDKQPQRGSLHDAVRHLDVPLLREIDECRSIVDRIKPIDWLVVDHYALDVEWEQAMRPYARRIVVIDDLPNRRHDCDLFLNQSLLPEIDGNHANLVPDACLTLLGPKYALLRPEFATAKQRHALRDGHVRRLLIFFGGADATGETVKALAAVKTLSRADLRVAVVVGRANPHMAAIEASCSDLPNVDLCCQVDNMAVHMAEADLFVGAGGTTSWERCCLGLPAVVIATAANQVAQSAALARAGAQLYLGPAEAVSAQRLAGVIDSLRELPDLLAHLAKQGEALVDGRGVNRVLDYMLASEIQLRSASLADSGAVYAWRNHPDTHRYAFDTAQIDRKTHEQWMRATLLDPNRELLIGEHGGRPVGVLRFDIHSSRALTSIYLVPGMSGQGWGKRLLLAGERWLREARPEVMVGEAEVAACNSASMALFESLGYQPYRLRLMKNIRGSTHDLQ